MVRVRVRVESWHVLVGVHVALLAEARVRLGLVVEFDGQAGALSCGKERARMRARVEGSRVRVRGR